MLRLLIYLCLVAPLAYLAIWVADHPGHLVLEWSGWQVETSLGVLLALTAAVFLLAIMATLVTRYILGMPSRVTGSRRARRQEQGLASLTRAMAALAIADYSQAEREINKSRHHLGNDAPAPLLLSAQLAHAKGNRTDVRKQLLAMMESPDTRLVGLRGMIELCLREGRIEQAITYASEAWSAQPKDRWLALMLLDLHLRERQWDEAQQVSTKASRSGALSRTDAARYEAIIFTLRATTSFLENQPERTLTLAKLALRHDAQFQPARLLLVQALEKLDEKAKLTKTITGFWKTAPHPEYIDTIFRQFKEEPLPKLQRRIDRLVAENPNHIESQLAAARMAMRAEKWDRARDLLKLALALRESPRVYEQLAELERQESGNDTLVAKWLQRALTAPKDDAWTCGNCGQISNEWLLHCSHCNAFDTLVWQSPGRPLEGGDPSTAIQIGG